MATTAPLETPNAGANAQALTSTQRVSIPTVMDALCYLDAVKSTFRDQPSGYTQFLGIMEDLKKDHAILNASKRVTNLLKEYPVLVEGLNKFMPPTYWLQHKGVGDVGGSRATAKIFIHAEDGHCIRAGVTNGEEALLWEAVESCQHQGHPSYSSNFDSAPATLDARPSPLEEARSRFDPKLANALSYMDDVHALFRQSAERYGQFLKAASMNWEAVDGQSDDFDNRIMDLLKYQVNLLRDHPTFIARLHDILVPKYGVRYIGGMEGGNGVPRIAIFASNGKGYVSVGAEEDGSLLWEAI